METPATERANALRAWPTGIQRRVNW